MERALERHENGTARVIPIILRLGDYKGARFSKLQALPTDGIPVTDRKWRNRNEAFFNVVQGIRKTVEELCCNEWLSNGNEFFLREQYQEALNAFEQAIYYNPDSALAYIGKGQTLIELLSTEPFGDNNEKALAAFTRAIELDPSNADGYVGKGISLFRMDIDDWQETGHSVSILKSYEDALRLDPENEKAYLAQGEAFIGYKNYERALESYEQAISFAAIPNRDGYKGKGDALFYLERYEEAVEAYGICVKAGLKNEYVYAKIAEALFSLGKYSEALAMYEKVLFLNAKLGEIHLEKGNMLYLLNRHQEALDAYEKATVLIHKYYKPRLAQAYRGKGNIWQLLSQEAFKKADELDPPEIDEHPF